MIAAVVQNNLVVNIVVADANVDTPPEDSIFVNIGENSSVKIGATYEPSSGDFVNPAVEPEDVVPEVITRRQCALQLLSVGMITGPEAVAMARDGTPPAAVQASIDLLTQEQQYIAEIDFAAANYYRNNPMLAELAAANNMDSDQIDQFFIAASAL